MCQKVWCTCNVVVLLIKRIAFFLTVLLPSRPRILQSLLSHLYRGASQCDPAKLATLLAEPTFCFSCQRCTALCKEMYEMLARPPRVARVGGWPVYPRQRLSEVRIKAMIFENSTNSLKWRFYGHRWCACWSSLLAGASRKVWLYSYISS